MAQSRRAERNIEPDIYYIIETLDKYRHNDLCSYHTDTDNQMHNNQQ